jgi:hypothetical protein
VLGVAALHRWGGVAGIRVRVDLISELTAYLAEPNVGIFSTDLDSFDFRTKIPDKVINPTSAESIGGAHPYNCITRTLT